MPERARPATPAEALQPYIAALRRWWSLIVAIVVVAGLAAFGLATQRPKSYEATAKVLLGQQRQIDALLGTADYSADPERDLNTSLQLVTLEPIADSVRRSLDLDESTAAVVGRVGVAVDRNSNILTISARDADRAQAAAIANAFAAAYHDYRAEMARAALQDAIAAAQARLPALPSGGARAALRRELTRLEVAEPLQIGGVQVVHKATAAAATSRPRPVISGLLGGFLGLVVAAVTLVALARTDQRVSGDGDLEQRTGWPVVARIPRSPRAATDAFVSLALSLPRGRSVLVTSPGPDEGTPEVALGLARALGLLDRPAVAIEADLRAPTFAERLGFAPSGGLAAILSGAARLEDELAGIGRAAAVVPAGSTADVPQALLAGDRMAATVEAARERADVVVIAGAPAGVVGDHIPLAGLVDAVLLVARDDVTRPRELARALRALTGAGRPPLGVVATVRPRRGLFGPAGAMRRHQHARAHGGPATSEVTAG